MTPPPVFSSKTSAVPRKAVSFCYNRLRSAVAWATTHICPLAAPAGNSPGAPVLARAPTTCCLVRQGLPAPEWLPSARFPVLPACRGSLLGVWLHLHRHATQQEGESWCIKGTICCMTHKTVRQDKPCRSHKCACHAAISHHCRKDCLNSWP